MTICPSHGLPMDLQVSAGPNMPVRMCERCWDHMLSQEHERLMSSMRFVTLTITTPPMKGNTDVFIETSWA